MKVFLDTNVWISAFLAPGLCEELLFRCLDDKLVLTSAMVWSELADVLARKTAASPQTLRDAEFLWRMSDAVADVSNPVDDNDARLIAAATAAGADLFVTGDRRVLEWNMAGATRIVSPREAWIILFQPPIDH